MALLQVGPIGDIGLRAASAERAGYRRFWCSQHYGHERSGSPLVAAALAAAATSTIRIGTSAVLLRHAQPAQVAADAALLSQQANGRFDLGIASATVAPLPIAEALFAEPRPSFEDDAAFLADLVAGTHDFASFAGPTAPPADLWICGASERSARIAASLGAGLAHGPITDRSRSSIDLYRRAFASVQGSSPQVSVLARGYCAGTTGEATAMWQSIGLEFVPDFLGNPDVCADAVDQLISDLGADECAIASVAPTLEAIDTSSTLLAKAAGLS